MEQEGFQRRRCFVFSDGWLTQKSREWTARARAWPEPQFLITYHDPLWAHHDKINPDLSKATGRTYVAGRHGVPGSAQWDVKDDLLTMASQMAQWSELDESYNVPEPVESGQLVLKGFRRINAEYDDMKDPFWLLLVSERVALRMFWATIPPDIQKELLLATSMSWVLLLIFSKHPRTVDLSRSNRRLFECLIAHYEYKSGSDFFDVVAAWSLQKQVKIMEYLGLPASETNRRILSRLSASHTGADILKEMLRRLEANPKIHRIIQHLPVINRGLQSILSSSFGFQNLTGPLLHKIARMNERDSERFYAKDFNDAIDLMRRAGLSERKIYSINQLHRLHDFLIAHLDPELLMSKDERALQFPAPPYMGTDTILPLTLPEEVFREGVEMRHCAATYSKRVAEHAVFLYRILEPVRATLELARDERGHWRYSQMQGKCNSNIADHVINNTVAALFASPASETALPRLIPDW